MQQALFLFADVIVEWKQIGLCKPNHPFSHPYDAKKYISYPFFTDACGGVKEKMCYIRTEIEKLAEWRRD